MNIKLLENLKFLFFGNKTVKQTIFKNTFWLAASEAISRFFTLLLIIYVARVLGAAEYGKFTFAIAFVSLFGVFSDLGLSPIVTREFSREKEEEELFPAIFTLKIVLLLGAIILTFIGSFFITSNPLIWKVIWILAVHNSINRFFEIVYAFLRARQRMEFEALMKIVQAALITGFGFFVILNFPSVLNLSLGYLLSSLVILVIVLLFFHFKVYRLRFSWDKIIWKKYLGMSWPLALAGFLGTIYNQTDSVMMGYLGQIAETGWYNAAYKVVRAALIPAVFISQSFYPALSVAFKRSGKELQKIWNYYAETLILIAVPMVVGGITLASRIINFIYNPSYAPSVLAFQILIIMAGIIFFHYPFNQILIVSNYQEKTFWVVFWGAIINVILNLILIPKFSFYGAAVATVITNILILFLLLRFVLKFTKINPFNLNLFFAVIGAVLSSVLMYLAISRPVIYYLHPLFSITLGAAVYLTFILIYKKLIKVFFSNKDV